jgi:molybdate/tungstate transport system substrate-binding protein
MLKTLHGGPVEGSQRSRSTTPAVAACAALVLSLVVVGPSAARPSSSDTVNVLAAGSLVNAGGAIGPAFAAASSYRYQGYHAGSKALATQIKGKVRKADVFISASPKVDASLMGAKNGSWVSWYVKFGTSPLVIGFSPKSKFAHDLRTMPWWKVVTMTGFKLGMTDPTLDPKGALSVTALKDAASAHHQPAPAMLGADKSNYYPEEALSGRLQSGQIDAGFFYAVEAKAGGFPTVGLGAIKLNSTYTITVLHNAPNQAGAEAFVSFVLGQKGKSILRKEKIVPMRPVVVGNRSAIPGGVTELAPSG